MTTPNLPAARAAQGARGILTGGRDYRDIPVLAYASAVAGTPWLMIAEIDEHEAYTGIRTMTWTTALIMGLGLLLVYSAGYLLWRRDRQRQELTALQAQRAADARFRVIFEQAPLGVALVDSNTGQVLEANMRLGEIVGHTPEQLVGINPMRRLTHPDDVRQSLDHTERLNAGEISGYRLNKRYIHPDGSVVWASVTCAPVQVDTDGAPRHLYIVEDITARKQMEERLRISEERHRLLADNAIDVIMTMDLEGRFSYVSPSVEKLRGFTVDQAEQQSLEEVFTPGSLTIARTYLGRLHANVAAGLPLENFRGELEQRCKDGTSVWTDVTASPLVSTNGTFVEILGVSRDVSERKRYEIELRQAYDAAEAANVAKSEFLAHMSHEIRTPMNAVLGLAQVLEREPLAGKQRGMVERIRTAGQSLLAILDDVLDLSKIESGRLRIEPRPFDLGILLANLDSLMGQAAGAKGLALRIEAPAALPGTLLGDGLRLEQVLLNLTGNAIKFTERGEVVVLVQARETGEMAWRLRFEVRDSAMNRDLMERALILEGATTTLAADGQQSVQLLKTRPEGFDAVRMDVQMPVMDGLSATRLIRGELGLTDLPVIAFTAGVRDEQQAAARAAGANDVLAKPMNLEEMVALLSKWVKPRRAEAERVPAGHATPAARTPADIDAVDAFPDMAGIDRGRAAQQLGGDRDMFISLLEMFCDDNVDAAELTRRELALGEREKAARWMHTLVSNAGFICALDIMESAKELEQAINQGEMGLDARIEALGNQIAELVKASAPWR